MSESGKRPTARSPLPLVRCSINREKRVNLGEIGDQRNSVARKRGYSADIGHFSFVSFCLRGTLEGESRIPVDRIMATGRAIIGGGGGGNILVV